MSLLDSCERQLLLQVARKAVALAVEGREPLEDLPQNEILNRPGGAFVTLRARRRLRGCIGHLPSGDPLVRVVAHCAKSAAVEDPRFAPLRADELSEVHIEISVLSPLEDIAPQGIEVGKHGLVVSRGWLRGVLLPQVAVEFQWTADRFLEETLAKAGLEKDAWKDPETRIQAFTADVFGESDSMSGDSAPR
jgi:uncharacterized protein